MNAELLLKLENVALLLIVLPTLGQLAVRMIDSEKGVPWLTIARGELETPSQASSSLDHLEGE